ncbi:hypothetical protein BLNAU_15681 [Blattamonas nauphoetae]|uniref:Uncharacterized protein n=1 Tax=Blattamonas nauphoetae TaxID=2049346 RepID=A0ABQ9XDF9_9EUKA|nr:hypothetical protein BLNAU_15681 [Blattamonas nauphoetae]
MLCDRCLFLLVPFRFNFFALFVIFTQLPVYLYYFAWESLSLWLSHLLLAPFTKSHRSRVIVCGLCIAISLILIIWHVIATPADIPSNMGVYNKYLVHNYIIKSLFYFVTFVSIAFCLVQFICLYATKGLTPKSKRVLRVPLLILIVNTILTLVRFVELVLRAFDVNPLFRLYRDEWLPQCEFDNDECNSASTYLFCLVFFFEYIPSLLFLFAFFLLLPQPKQRKGKRLKARRRIQSLQGINSDAPSEHSGLLDDS